MLRNLFVILKGTIFKFSFLEVIKNFTIIYYILSDDFFRDSNYLKDFEFNAYSEKFWNLSFYSILIPLVILIFSLFWIKKILKTNWILSIVSCLISIVLFRFFHDSFNNIFIISSNNFINMLLSTMSFFFIMLIILRLKKMSEPPLPKD
jgi:hypothetical protein